MGVYTRVKDIFGSNINSLLDKAEDPEKMIRLMMQEIEDTMVDLKSSCSEKTALVSSMEKEKEGLLDSLSNWEGRAKIAVETGKDELAREALHEKKNCSARLEYLDKEISFLNEIVGESKGHIIQLEEKLEQISQKHRLLIQRGIHARDKKAARETIYYATGTEAIHRFDEMENRIERMEADAELAGSVLSRESELEGKFSRMENSSEIEDELAAMKNKMSRKQPEKASESK